MRLLSTTHGWVSLTHDNTEKRGYGLYTYVLYGRRPSGPTSNTDGYFLRLSRLLQAIKETTPTAAVVEESFARAETNLFVIPETAPNVHGERGYGFDLAKTLLLRFSDIEGLDPSLSQRLRDNAGPFLVSIHAPLAEIKGQTVPLLLIDLSTTNQAAMEEVVTEYKRRVETQEVATVERFRSLKLALLNFIVNRDDDLVLVESALASWSE
jgi:hypothetical protein